MQPTEGEAQSGVVYSCHGHQHLPRRAWILLAWGNICLRTLCSVVEHSQKLNHSMGMFSLADPGYHTAVILLQGIV